MRTRLALLFGITLAVTSFDLPAQEVRRRITEPTPLAATDPQAVRTAVLVKHLLAGEKAEAVALLTKDGDEAYVKGGGIEKDVDAQIKRLSAGKFTIKEFEQGFGADVVVFLTSDKGEESNLVVRYNADKRFNGFAEAKITR